jgi:glycosyltransferase involved in cell wall biosynthesis
MSALAYTVPIYSWMLRGRIERFLRDYGIEAIHVHDMVVGEACILANRSLKLPALLDLHENRPEIMALYPHLQRFPGKYLVSINRWRKKEEALARSFDRTMVVTEQARQDLSQRAGVDVNRILLMPNTVSPKFFEAAEREESSEGSDKDQFKEGFVLLYLGDTGLRRGLLTAIEALPILKRKIPEIRLILVGSNSTDLVLKAKVKELNLEESVDFEGWKDESLFASYLESADVCLSPLHRNKHHDTTLANKLFQYMGFSKPILASDALAQAEIIERAECGLVHRSEDAADFAEKCQRLFDDRELRRILGKNGKKFLLEEFSLDQVGAPMREYYRSLNQNAET